MAVSDYMRGPEWKELVPATVLGRPVTVYRERLRRITDLLDVAAVLPEMDLIVQGDRRISFGHFTGAIDAGAAALQAAGVGPGDHVLLVLHNSAEFPLAQWASWKLGAIPVLGNRWWSDRELADVLELVEPKVTITDRPLPAGGGSMVTPSEVAGWWSVPRPPQSFDAHPDEDDVAVVVFTAGSTGIPKGVQVSHRSLLHIQQTLHVMRGGRPPAPTSREQQQVALMTTPLFHNGGLTAGLTALLDGNRIVVLKGRFDAGEVLELIERERVTSWNAVPTMYQRVLEHPDFPNRDVSSLVAPSTGGAMVPAKLFEVTPQKFTGAVRGMTVGYGMTEASFVTITPGTAVATRPGTVGMPIPSVEIRILDPDTNGEGEVLARSAAVMVGYLGIPPEQQPIDAEGWYRTGDLGRIDEEGYLYITGRAREIVIRGGENISTPQVEAVLAEHRDVVEAAALGIPHPDYGEEVCAVVYRRTPKLTEEELTAFAAERLAKFAVPSRWLLLDEQLPVLPTGKLDRIGLRERLVQMPVS